VEKAKRGEIDLSREEDLAVGLMNLISLEEHLFFTAMKTENKKYIDLMEKIRELRKKLLAEIVKEPKGEEWCISKHLLAASMRLIEVGNKHLTRGEKKEAEEKFRMAYDLFSLFWAINLKMVGFEKLKEKKEDGFFSRLRKIVGEIVDCCLE